MPQARQPAPRRRPWKWLFLIPALCLGVGIIGALVNPPSDQPAVPATAIPTIAVRAVQVDIPSSTPEVSPTLPLPPEPDPPTATEPPAATPQPVSPTLPAPTATTPAGPTAAQNGNLRAGPGTDFAKTGSVTAGQALQITGRNVAGDWFELAGGKWIAAFLVANAPRNVGLASRIPAPPTSAPVVRSAPAVPNASLSNCDCSRNRYNCDDFVAFDAQSCYLRCMTLAGRDIHGLDGDNDGRACEWEY